MRSASPSTAMNELRAAVVGAGRLGSLHARKYAAIPGVKLRYVVDIDPHRAIKVGVEAGAEPLVNLSRSRRQN